MNWSLDLYCTTVAWLLIDVQHQRTAVYEKSTLFPCHNTLNKEIEEYLSQEIHVTGLHAVNSLVNLVLEGNELRRIVCDATWSFFALCTLEKFCCYSFCPVRPVQLSFHFFKPWIDDAHCCPHQRSSQTFMSRFSLGHPCLRKWPNLFLRKRRVLGVIWNDGDVALKPVATRNFCSPIVH